MSKNELSPEGVPQKENFKNLTLCRKLCSLPRNSFVGKAGRIVAVSAIVGFSVLGTVNSVATEVSTKGSQRSYQAEKNGFSQDTYQYTVSAEDKCADFTCGDYTDCTVDIGCVIDLPCSSVQFPCIYGIYFPEW